MRYRLKSAYRLEKVFIIQFKPISIMRFKRRRGKKRGGLKKFKRRGGAKRIKSYTVSRGGIRL